jgi:hypothetical protein
MAPKGVIGWLNLVIGGGLVLFLLFQGLGMLGSAVSRGAAPPDRVRVVTPKPAADRRADRTDARRAAPAQLAPVFPPGGPAVITGSDGQPLRD